MMVKWNVSGESLEVGLEKLKKATYPQKKYRPRRTIEKIDPMSRFKFYGFVSERSFTISPVILGYNRNVTVLYGNIVETEEGAELTIKGKLAPVNRIIFGVLFALMVFGICIALFMGGGLEDYRLVGRMVLMLAMGVLVRVSGQIFADRQAAEALSFLRFIFEAPPV